MSSMPLYECLSAAFTMGVGKQYLKFGARLTLEGRLQLRCGTEHAPPVPSSKHRVLRQRRQRLDRGWGGCGGVEMAVGEEKLGCPVPPTSKHAATTVLMLNQHGSTPTLSAQTARW